MRLNRFIAQSGVTSRRKADDFISQGRVQVNGEVVTDFGLDVAEKDVVLVDWERVSPPTQTVIVAMNKPRGVTTTLEDAHATQTVLDLLPPGLPRLNPVGRLDKESEGLLLLTNDGDLHHELTHPSFEHEKEYQVEVAHPISDAQLAQLANGVKLKEGTTAQVTVHRIGPRSFTLVLRQGWKRQIRRMVESVDNHVTLLKRTRIGRLELGDLPTGHVRQVRREEIVYVC